MATLSKKITDEIKQFLHIGKSRSWLKLRYSISDKQLDKIIEGTK